MISILTVTYNSLPTLKDAYAQNQAPRNLRPFAPLPRPHFGVLQANGRTYFTQHFL